MDAFERVAGLDEAIGRFPASQAERVGQHPDSEAALRTSVDVGPGILIEHGWILPASWSVSVEKPPQWQMPAGVDSSVWDYLHSPELADAYETGLAGSSLFRLDMAYVREHCPKPGRFVDLGCGTGRLLRELAPEGYTGTGVDLSPEMLRVARGLAAGLPLEWVEANLTDLSGFPEASFDHAACLFSTLGMIRGSAARLEVLRGAWRLLRPGGVLILHVHNRWWRLYDAPGRSWILGDFCGRRDRDLDAGDHRMPVHQGIAGLVLHLFTRNEIQQLLTLAGFRLRDLRPISLAEDGRLSAPGWFPSYRAYGFLIAVEKPSAGTTGSASSQSR